MNIQNLVRLINAKLLNAPFISGVEDFTFNALDVKPKSAFIAINASYEDIQKAMELGAYAIIFDSNFEPLNEEIAFIKVDNLNTALFKLIRFFVTLKEIKFVYTSNLQTNILKHSILSKNAMFAKDNVEELFMEIINAKENAIFFSKNLSIIKKITKTYQIINQNLEAKEDIQSSIFYLNFWYKDEYYKLNFPQLFLPQIYGILEFMDKNDIEIKFKDLRNLEHFEPIFVDRFYNVKNYGDSYRAFIIESDKELFIKESEFLKSKFKDRIITFSHTKDKVVSDIKYNNLQELKIVFNFHYALVLGNKEEILNMLMSSEEEKTLFDF